MIVITGASSGLGEEIAKLYYGGDQKIVNISRRDSSFADINVKCDLTNDEDIESAVETLANINEPIAALINCAGMFKGNGIESINKANIEEVFSTNTSAMMLLTSKLIGRLKNDGADILNIISTAGVKPTTELIYGTSKWAARGFTLGLQAELKNTPCRVISFCPGGMSTGLFAKANGNPDGINQWMDPGEIALLIKQILHMPKNIEVSEIVINRKSA